MVVAQIDAVANDVPGLEPEGYPTIVLYSKANKEVRADVLRSVLCPVLIASDCVLCPIQLGAQLGAHVVDGLMMAS